MSAEDLEDDSNGIFHLSLLSGILSRSRRAFNLRGLRRRFARRCRFQFELDGQLEEDVIFAKELDEHKLLLRLALQSTW